ncbi:30S ribosomal protein S3ae [Candidatus Bathyarchaeota archaeon RBG_16_57_9]|nr:MAG: 30S ribosomal protein S3ae [Candidatus Bathyarchaeota archaeon RBG_16_57_9]OGD53070.1 MAG: 30S ribosomal protein S3ae [Candidatus Bathyarchaeota archaeon RBG_13_60_20]
MSRAVKDKWRRKEWYDIILPRYFGETKVGETPCEEAEKVMGRVFETTLAAITGDFSQEYMKMYFQVNEIEGHTARTVFKGHEYLRDYLRSLVRRRSTKVDGYYRVYTKDGYRIKIIVTAMTQTRIKTSDEKAIRNIMEAIVNEKVQTLTFDQLAHEMVLGKLASDVYNLAKNITTLRHVGVRKSELLALPN